MLPFHKKLHLGKEIVMNGISIRGMILEHPLMNAAGTCKTIEELRVLVRTPISAVMVGTITINRREINSGEVFFADSHYSLNSLGLPNPGAIYYKHHLSEMVKLAHDNGKPLFLSVSGLSDPHDYMVLVETALLGGVDAVELNLGCPNVWERNHQEPIPSFQTDLVGEILRRVTKVVEDPESARIVVKLSPFSNPANLHEIAKVVSQYQIVCGITSSNTFPNAIGMDDHGKSLIGGPVLAGLAGSALKAIALGQVYQLRSVLPTDIVIFGVGGVTRGVDILQYQNAGASVVQVATAYLTNGVHVFERILSEYLHY